MKVKAWLSLGSNIDRERHLRAALGALSRQFGGLRSSSVYESRAVGFEGAPFLNMVVGIETDKSPDELKTLLRGIEVQEGRQREAGKFSARTLDIDLLTYGNQVIERHGKVLIPRDEITRYAFVLGPLAEVAGEERHPLFGTSYAELWAAQGPASNEMRRIELDLH
ncbi:MAG: 2-amino-4-hydroxy-6-hydroxymethyldihydropteridine diphosphokinase [Gammaproteobacteria bacterium]|nr:2-amino-4-hydroxy-6-hydroxymethyldihydropteridine diphosphokinase [Gammaproteobacteria bacterium]